MCREVLGAFDEESPVLGEVPLVTATVSPQAAAGSDAFWLAGKATVRRLRRWKFPAFELEQDRDVLATWAGRGGSRSTLAPASELNSKWGPLDDSIHRYWRDVLSHHR
jgi:hypothetical protein